MSRPLVTVSALIAQARERGRIELPADALITPAAQDWLRGSRFPVQRTAPQRPAPDDAPTYYLIGDAADPYLQALLPGLERRFPGLRFLPCHGRCEGLLAAIDQMCAGLRCGAACGAGAAAAERAGRARRGVIIVSSGAIANCVANKHQHVRAAIVCQPSALLPLLRELALNVLIIEKERTSLRQAQGLIDTFFNAAQSAPAPAVAAALAGAGGVTASAPLQACACGTGA